MTGTGWKARAATLGFAGAFLAALAVDAMGGVSPEEAAHLKSKGRQAQNHQPTAAAQLTIDNADPDDGHIDLTADDYGSFGDWGSLANAWRDNFDPSPDPDFPDVTFDLQAPTFGSHVFFFIDPSGIGNGTHRVLPTSHPDANDYNTGDLAGCTNNPAAEGLEFAVITPNALVNSNTMSSVYHVFGGSIDLRVNLTQFVEPGAPGPDCPDTCFEQARFVQMYQITNQGSPVTFHLNKHIDEDLPWDGATGTDFALNDLVGVDTGVLGYPQVFAQDAIGDEGIFSAALILRVVQADGTPYTTSDGPKADPEVDDFVYYAVKQGLPAPPENPDYPTGVQCPDFDYGTDCEVWENYGVPNCWKNVVAALGHNVQGTTPQVSGDTSIGLQHTITLGGGASYTVRYETLYGFRPIAPRFAPPILDTLLVDRRDDGCVEYYYSVRNVNPGGQVQPDPITTLYVDLETGDSGSQGVCPASVTLDGFATSQNCTGFTEGHAVFRLTGGSINPGESASGRIVVRPNGATAAAGHFAPTVPPLSTLISVSQDFPGAEDEFEPVCASADYSVGPRAGDGGLWSQSATAIGFLNVPSMSAWAKTVLVLIVLAMGTLLVMRGRRTARSSA